MCCCLRAMRRLVVVALIGSVSTASADDLSRANSRAAAEALEKDSRLGGVGFAKAVECGQAYLDLYNQDPAAADADEIVYNASVCFERGRSIGLAIQLSKQITTSWPRSKLVPRALARLGK